MRLSELFSWLEVASLEEADPSLVLLMVRQVEEPGQCASLLARCAERLQRGESPSSALSELRRAAPRLDPGEELEAQLRHAAEQLGEEELATARMDDLIGAILSFSQQPEGLESYLEQLQNEILRTWEDYSAIPVADSEITVEAVVGHRFLAEGVEEWLSAVRRMRRGDWDGALRAARRGNRLLLAVQRFQRQVTGWNHSP